MRLCIIEWLDIYASAGWEKADEIEPQRLWSIGYLIYKDKGVLKIANTKDEKDEYYGITAFPIGCVVSITDIPSTVSVE
tara:strand:- start:842 stop:1078 length:237 start_codon:yes stop_codon:yes gene_type:complete